MKIAIDARFFGTNTGIGRYVENLIFELEKIDKENEYFILIKPENEAKYIPQYSNFKKIIVDIHWYGLSEQFQMPRVLNKLNVDLVHFSHFNVPIFYNKRFIVSIHDLILTKYPSTRATTLSPIKYFLKNLLYKIVINHAIDKSEKVITMAEYTKDEIVKMFKVKSDKVVVSFEGLTSIKVDESLREDIVLEKYKVDSKYILYVGNAYPHKNLEFLLQAFKKFLEINNEHKLVLVGKKDYFYSRLEEFSNKLGLKNVIFAGFVPDNELSFLYKNASAYVFPSLCEGFGLPPLEAMNYEIPVLSSNYSCLPEILGNSAMYFDPKSEKDFIEKLNLILSDEDTRKTLIKNSKEVLKKYSWGKMAEEILEEYQILNF